MFETALDGILLLNAETAQIEDVNPFLIALLGYSHAEFLGRKLWEVGPFADIAQSKDMFEKIQVDGRVRYENLPLKTKGGARIDVEFVSNSYECEGIVVIQCNIRDITERKAAEAAVIRKGVELTASNAELEQFAYVASHDLREPLRMINAFLSLLERRNPQLDAESKEILEYAKDGAVRMDTLVLALLEFSRVGRTAITHVLVDIGAAVADALSDFDLLIAETGVEVNVATPMPVVMGNRQELTRLFQNLIGNAVKYRHPDRRMMVEVSCRPTEVGWQFAVADNGIGIESDYFDRIFVLFQRLHTRSKYQGTGIGLAVCKKTAEGHGGRIWVESVPGQGTTFFMTLPKAPMN